MAQSARMLAGLIAGLAPGILASMHESAAVGRAIDVLEPVGTLWIRALQMTVIPLMTSLLIGSIMAAAAQENVARIARREFLGSSFMVSPRISCLPAVSAYGRSLGDTMHLELQNCSRLTTKLLVRGRRSTPGDVSPHSGSSVSEISPTIVRARTASRTTPPRHRVSA